VEAAVVFFAGFFAGVFFAEAGLEAALFDAVVFVGVGVGVGVGAVAGAVACVGAVAFAGAVALAAGGDGASPVSTGDWDWATAGDKRPRQSREKIPAKTATAKRRTQTLPSAESWHP
jgi:hypothetical protein